MALLLKPCTGWDPPHSLPRYLQLELSKRVLRNIELSFLLAFPYPEHYNWLLANPQYYCGLCDKCDLHDVQDKTLA